ncbi:RodZ domain-containing protein [Gilvimarinus polysaccharolyticus]|uniref:RodZ domain-containing protein n=1 Tax=Gilvimarinus polysaccharolyticus TaxID=863921 RepID=UPI000673B1FA|nr:RodZ domain-containing protein [Gilvimarinus polysaccharolyticus]
MSDETNMDSTLSPNQSIGAKLVEARERQGKSREQIASVLNIQLDKIVALETDQYQKLFSPVFARGYLRSYGKYLGLDEDMLVRDFDANFAPAEDPLTQSESLNVKINSSRPVWPARIAMAIVLLLLLGVLYWYFAAHKTPANETRSDISEQNDNAPIAEIKQSVALGLSSTMSEPEGDAESSKVVSDLTIGDVSSVEVDVASSAMAAEPMLDELVISFDGECWLEVHDANGDSLAADLQRQGTSVTLHGVAPFDVKLGNPEGVEIALNGDSVNIPEAAGADKVVRFDVNTET